MDIVLHELRDFVNFDTCFLRCQNAFQRKRLFACFVFQAIHNAAILVVDRICTGFREGDISGTRDNHLCKFVYTDSLLKCAWDIGDPLINKHHCEHATENECQNSEPINSPIWFIFLVIYLLFSPLIFFNISWLNDSD